MPEFKVSLVYRASSRTARATQINSVSAHTHTHLHTQRLTHTHTHTHKGRGRKNENRKEKAKLSGILLDRKLN